MFRTDSNSSKKYIIGREDEISYIIKRIKAVENVYQLLSFLYISIQGKYISKLTGIQRASRGKIKMLNLNITLFRLDFY